jgi:hypothetical protein
LAEKNVYQVDLRELMAQHFDSMIRQIEDSFHKRLPSLFSVGESEFSNTKIKLTFDRDALLQRAIDNEWKTKLSLGKEKDWFLYIEKAANQSMLTLSWRQTDNPQEILTAFISSHIVKLIFSNICHRSNLTSRWRKPKLSMNNILKANWEIHKGFRSLGRILNKFDAERRGRHSQTEFGNDKKLITDN